MDDVVGKLVSSCGFQAREIGLTKEKRIKVISEEGVQWKIERETDWEIDGRIQLQDCAKMESFIREEVLSLSTCQLAEHAGIGSTDRLLGT